MTNLALPLLRRAAACLDGAFCTFSSRAILLAIVAAAFASPAQAAPPFEVRVTGSGPDVLLIPGLASSGAVWDATVKALAPHHRCHVFTLAGFAGVPAQPGPLPDDADAAIAAYIEQQHLTSPVVVGHSLGGFVALKLAIDHPADVGRLVIVDALPALGAVSMDSLTPQQLHDFAPQMKARMLAMDPAAYAAAQEKAVAGLVTAPADLARVQGWGKASDRAAVIDAMSAMLGEDLRSRVAGIKAPTLVMGSWIAYKDSTTMEASRAVYERQYKRLAGVQIAMAPTARHFIMLDDPAWFDATLDKFIR